MIEKCYVKFRSFAVLEFRARNLKIVFEVRLWLLRTEPKS